MDVVEKGWLPSCVNVYYEPSYGPPKWEGGVNTILATRCLVAFVEDCPQNHPCKCILSGYHVYFPTMTLWYEHKVLALCAKSTFISGRKPKTGASSA